MRRLAPMVNWAKNARINSSGCSPAQWVIGRGHEDSNEGERQVEEPDLATEESREIECDQLRRRLTTKQSRKLGRVPELSYDGKKVESRLKKARAIVSELPHDVSLMGRQAMVCPEL